MEIDTGAAVSIISKPLREGNSSTTIHPSKTRLRTLTGEEVTVAGALQVVVNHGFDKKQLSLLVTRGQTPNPLGRDWLSQLKVDLKATYKVRPNPGGTPDTHSVPRGTCEVKGMKVKIHVDPDVHLQYYDQSRFPCKRCMEDELTRLDQTLQRVLRVGIPVLKSDGLPSHGKQCDESGRIQFHHINEERLHPTDKKASAITAAPEPKNVSELKPYTGLINYYGKFLPNLSTLLAPLYRLLKKNTRWRWGKEQQAAFERTKELLTSPQLLVHYDSRRN